MSNAPDEKDLGYTVTRWRLPDHDRRGSLPNYECNECPYSTLDAGLIDQHVWKAHRMPQEFSPGVPIFGPTGELLSRPEPPITVTEDDGEDNGDIG